MRRRALTIGLCVCLAGIATMLLAQQEGSDSLKADERHPASDVSAAGGSGGMGGFGMVDDSTNQTDETTEAAGAGAEGSSATKPSDEWDKQDPTQRARLLRERKMAALAAEARRNAGAVAPTARFGRNEAELKLHLSEREFVFEERSLQLIAKWKAMQNDADREKIKQDIKKVLSEQFNARLAKQEKEVEPLEGKLKELREQLELRKSKRDEIVDFRLRQILQVAQGLGWGDEVIIEKVAVPERMTAQPMTTQPTEEDRRLSMKQMRKAARSVEIFDQLIARWKAAKNDADRTVIEKEMRDALVHIFDVRLAANEKEIEELETKVKELRGQVELRRSKQDEIVNFRMEQLLRDAQGLGWGNEPKEPAGARHRDSVQYGIERSSTQVGNALMSDPFGQPPATENSLFAPVAENKPGTYPGSTNSAPRRTR